MINNIVNFNFQIFKNIKTKFEIFIKSLLNINKSNIYFLFIIKNNKISFKYKI